MTLRNLKLASRILSSTLYSAVLVTNIRHWHHYWLVADILDFFKKKCCNTGVMKQSLGYSYTWDYRKEGRCLDLGNVWLGWTQWMWRNEFGSGKSSLKVYVCYVLTVCSLISPTMKWEQQCSLSQIYWKGQCNKNCKSYLPIDFCPEIISHIGGFMQKYGFKNEPFR